MLHHTRILQQAKEIWKRYPAHFPLRGSLSFVKGRLEALGTPAVKKLVEFCLIQLPDFYMTTEHCGYIPKYHDHRTTCVWVVCKTLLENTTIEIELKWKKATFWTGGIYLGCCPWKCWKLYVFFENTGGKGLIVGEGVSRRCYFWKLREKRNHK